MQRLDVLAYLFNRTYWPDRLNCGRTSPGELASRNAGASQTPPTWTPHPRDQSADLLILMRNRALIASHGRFLQPDPNATGLPVMGDLSFGGSALSPPRPEVELSRWTTDGLNVLAYCGGDSVNRGDPTGLYLSRFPPSDWELPDRDDIEDAIEEAEYWQEMGERTYDTLKAYSNVSGMIENALFALVNQYSLNQSDDVDWAMDWSRRDDDYSRMSNRWVNASLALGVATHFNVQYWRDRLGDYQGEDDSLEELANAISAEHGLSSSMARGGGGRAVKMPKGSWGGRKMLSKKDYIKYVQLRQQWPKERKKFWKEVYRTGSYGQYSSVFKDTPKNRSLMKNGKAPIGVDGKRVHLHHKKALRDGGTNDRENFEPVTQTNHIEIHRNDNRKQRRR